MTTARSSKEAKVRNTFDFRCMKVFIQLTWDREKWDMGKREGKYLMSYLLLFINVK